MATSPLARMLLIAAVGAAAQAPARADPLDLSERIFVDSFETSPCDTNPACAQFTVLGEVSGDTSGPVLQATGTTEAWYKIRVTEDNNSNTPLSAVVALTVPAGTDFDLYVYCTSCGGALAGKSTLSGSATEVVEVAAEDQFLGVDDSFDLLIEVRHISGLLCGQWTLQVVGDVPVSVSGTTCP